MNHNLETEGRPDTVEVGHICGCLDRGGNIMTSAVDGRCVPSDTRAILYHIPRVTSRCTQLPHNQAKATVAIILA